MAGPHYGHPAIAYSSRSEFYDTFQGEFDTAFEGGEVLRLQEVHGIDVEKSDDIRSALQVLGLSAVAPTEDDVVAVRSMIREPEQSNEYR